MITHVTRLNQNFFKFTHSHWSFSLGLDNKGNWFARYRSANRGRAVHSSSLFYVLKRIPSL